jgi:DNA-binding transcriptional ArsR family regulator
MKDGPNVARIACLLGDAARSEVLTALLAGRALTATELSEIAGVTKQTMSAHLSQLLAGGLVLVDQQGRHRYFRLANEDVAQLLESLMGVAFRTGCTRLLPGPREPALRNARVCYDHLAGERAVMAFETLLRIKAFEPAADGLGLSPRGRQWFSSLGIDVAAAARQRRAFCRPCMDWSERRLHLAGRAGAALAQHAFARDWIARMKGSRAVTVSDTGATALHVAFGIPAR